MNIWITGAGGFLGSCLTERLLAGGTDCVTALTSRPDELRRKVPDNGCLRVLDADPAGLFSGGDVADAVLVNCAFPRSADGPGMASGLSYVSRVLEQAAEAGFGGVVNISSQSVYDGKRTEPADEHSPLCPDTPYAVGKYASELLTAAVCQERYTNIRLASLIGPGFDQRITNKLVDAALAKKELRVKRNRQVFGFLDVRDAAEGIIRLIRTDPAGWKPVYNLGNGAGYTLPEIAATVAEVLLEIRGMEIRVVEEENETASNSSVKAGLLERDTGFAAGMTLKDSIRTIALEKIKQYEHSD